MIVLSIKMGIIPHNLNHLQTMNRKILFWPLAVVLLTACEKGLVEDVADVGPSGSTSDGTFRLTADPDWDSVNGFTF